MATPTVTLLMLTRGRPQLAIAAVESAIANTAVPLQVFVAVDDDEPSARVIVNALHDKARIFLLQLRHYYSRGFNACFKLAREAYMHEMDLFSITNDDVSFAPQWAERATHALFERFPDGMGILELAGPELCAHYLSRKRFFLDHFDGLLAEPAYTFYCSDTELRNRCQAMQRYAYFGEPLIQHHVKQDNVRSEVEYWYPLDRETFKRRAAQHPEWQREVWQT